MFKKLLYFTVGLLVLGQLTAITKSEGSNLYLFDLGVAVLAVAGLFLVYRRHSAGCASFGGHKSLIVPHSLLPFALFSVFAVVSLAVRAGELTSANMLIAAFYLVRWLVYLLAAVVVVNAVNVDIISREEVLAVFMQSGIVLAVMGFIQLAVVPDFTRLDPGLGWDPHKNRLASTFFDPNFCGAYLVLCLYPAVLYTRLHKGFLGKVVPIGILLIAVLFTFSRSAWLMLTVAVFVYGFFRSKKLLFVSFLMLVLVYAVAPRIQSRLAGITDPADSAAFRLVSWRHALTISGDNILFGVGFNAYRAVQADYGFIDSGTVGGNAGAGADSGILFVLATTGVFGVVIFGYGFVSQLIVTFGESRQTNVHDYREEGVLFLAVMLGLLVESQFVNSLFYPPILLFWLLMFGLLQKPPVGSNMPPAVFTVAREAIEGDGHVGFANEVQR